MKKLYKFIGSSLVIASFAMSASAQQLPNVGFENWKTTCGKSEAISIGDGSSTMRERPGVEPADWNGSSVNQYLMIEVKKQLVFNLENGGVNNSSCVQLKNDRVEVLSMGDEAPGFITFGTPWVSVGINIDNCDGGTYGGVKFTNKPDAIMGQFKRVDSNNESSLILAYLWNGTFKSKIGSKSSPNLERENVDRAILGTVTNDGDGKLVAKGEYKFKSTNSDWEQIIVPINYVEGAGEPTMMNVVICGGDYYNRGNLIKGTELHVDDVKFVYYSRLSSLSIGGSAIDKFDSKQYEYSHTYYGEFPTEADIDAVVMGQSATKVVELDAVNQKIKITVSNIDVDEDGAKTHTYTINCVKGEGVMYPGYLNIIMGGQNIAPNSPSKIIITDKGDGTCDFLLPNLVLPGLGNLGDIVLENVAMTTDSEGTTTYTGKKDGMLLLSGAIKANVTLSGTITSAGVANMDIDVLWLADPSVGNVDTPIDVTFTSDIVSGIEDIIINSNSQAEYYNLQGVKVANPENGIFIKIQGGKATKMYIK